MDIKKHVIFFMIIAVSFSFLACETSSLPSLSCSGTINFNNIGLYGVEIKSTAKHYASTNQNGEFSFKTRATSVTIYPKKNGYIFSPESITLNKGDNTEINFVAYEIKKLSGSLTLEKVIVYPTVVSTAPDNYLYYDKMNNKNYVKLKNVYIWEHNSANLASLGGNFLYVYNQNDIETSLNTQYSCGQNFSVGILLNTHFISMGGEEFSTSGQNNKNNYSFLNVSNQQTNADLVNNRIIYTLYDINNHLKTITYNVSFVFEYKG